MILVVCVCVCLSVCLCVCVRVRTGCSVLAVWVLVEISVGFFGLHEPTLAPNCSYPVADTQWQNREADLNDSAWYNENSAKT